mgnify:CR=1 FL=1
MDPLLLVGAAVSTAILGVVAWGRVRAVNPRRVDRWDRAPTLWYGPGIDRIDIAEALRTWSGLGHVVVLVNDPGADIAVTVDPALGPAGFDESGDLGVTKVFVTTDHRIVKVAVRVMPGADALVLAHELGHAFGYQHPWFCPTGHLLNPRRPGWDTRGLENTP